MPEKKRYLRLKLENPKDAQEYIRRLLRNLKERGPDAEIEYLGRISQILSVWLKSYELNKLDEIEKRLAVLERDKENQK
jgi:hypothetical protein